MSRKWILKTGEGIAIWLVTISDEFERVSTDCEGILPDRASLLTDREGILTGCGDVLTDSEGMKESRQGAANVAHGVFRFPVRCFEIFLYAIGSMQHAFTTNGNAATASGNAFAASRIAATL